MLKMTEESTKNLNLQDSNPSLQTGEIIVYNPNDSIHLEVRMEHESVWLTQSQMGTLFGVDRTVIVKHIGNVYESGELDEISTCAIIAQVRKEGKRIQEIARPFSHPGQSSLSHRSFAQRPRKEMVRGVPYV